jgi:hypothetical protein
MSGVAGMTKSPGGKIVSDEVIEALQIFESTRNGHVTRSSATGIAITAAELLSKVFRHTSIGSAQNDTLPTVASVIAALEAYGPFPVGSSIRTQIQNSGGAFVITITNGGDANWTLTGTMTLAATTGKEFIITRTGAGTAELLSMGAGGIL